MFPPEDGFKTGGPLIMGLVGIGLVGIGLIIGPFGIGVLGAELFTTLLGPDPLIFCCICICICCI